MHEFSIRNILKETNSSSSLNRPINNNYQIADQNNNTRTQFVYIQPPLIAGFQLEPSREFSPVDLSQKHTPVSYSSSIDEGIVYLSSRSSPAIPDCVSKSISSSDVDKSTKDSEYWLKRLKNNAAAKKSRDKKNLIRVQRRMKIMQLMIENEQMKHQLYLCRCPHLQIEKNNLSDNYYPSLEVHY